MDFSLDWFLSIPGLLITGGVLLFLIAFILLIVTMLKRKKENNHQIQHISFINRYSTFYCWKSIKQFIRKSMSTI